MQQSSQKFRFYHGIFTFKRVSRSHEGREIFQTSLGGHQPKKFENPWYKFYPEAATTIVIQIKLVRQKPI
jgi:hypothetical protein